MGDLVERLEYSLSQVEIGTNVGMSYSFAHDMLSALTDQADEIARLREERRGLVEALRPFANYRGSDEYLKSAPDDGYCSAASFTAGAYRNARAMIAAADDGGR